jgi:prepilin-type N-terminal cleavage/methylation domain-containing protein
VDKLPNSSYNRFMKPKARLRGFTLIELMVVIAIISLLSSIILAALNSARDKAKATSRNQFARQLTIALELYYTANGGYPWPSQQQYATCVGKHFNQTCNAQGGPGWGGDDTLYNSIKQFIGYPAAIINDPMTSASLNGNTTPIVVQNDAIVYDPGVVNGSVRSQCTGNLCQAYTLTWDIPGIKQNCSPGFRTKYYGDAYNCSDYGSIGVTECQLHVPAQPGDGNVTQC